MKHKNKVALMSTVLVVTLFAVYTATARYKTDVEGYACGTLSQYKDDPTLPAELLEGIW